MKRDIKLGINDQKMMYWITTYTIPRQAPILSLTGTQSSMKLCSKSFIKYKPHKY